MSVMRRLVVISLGCALVTGCGQKTLTLSDPEVLRVKNNFLEDVVEAEVASRIAGYCPDFAYNDAEGERVQKRFSNSVLNLYANPRANPAQVLVFQQYAEEAVSSRQIRKTIGKRAAAWMNQNGVTKDTPEALCERGTQEVKSKSQIGRFLRPVSVEGDT